MKLPLCTLLLMASISDGFCQSRSIVGRILSADDQKPIKNANVILLGTTRGTFSNHLGYFGLDILESDPQTLVVSHIGFSTSQFEIPETDNFLVRLEKQFIEIAEFDMAYFEPQNLSPVSETDAVIQALEMNAKYPGGWEYFFNDLGKELQHIQLFGVLGDSSIQVYFTVDKSGRITNLDFSRSIEVYSDSISIAINSLKNWIPASQRNNSVEQHFLFSLKWSEIYTVIQDPARPSEGMNEFYRSISKQLKYPAQARRLGIQGVVIVEFIIEADGSITNAKIVKGIGGGCDEEALRIISIAPKWNPGTQKGKPVKQRVVLPITFKLG